MGSAGSIVLDGSGAFIRSCRVLTSDADGDPVWSVWGAGGRGFEAEPTDLAEWIAGVLAGAPGVPDTLGRLVVSGPSVRCHWISTPSTDPKVVRGAVAQGRVSAWGDWPEPGGGDGAGLSMVDTGAVAVQAVAPEIGEGWSGRVAGLAVGDTAVRVLLDELDARRVRVGLVLSQWQALAHAWDPGSVVRRSGIDAVDAPDPATAVIAIDGRPEGGGAPTLSWAWSRSGVFVAGGTRRFREGALARAVSMLAVDWMGWAAEVGFAPERGVCVLDPLAVDSGEALAVLDGLPGGGAAGLPVDAVSVEDPVAVTIERLARRGAANAPAADDPTGSIVALSTRPGRTHRSMCVWIALSVMIVAGAFGVLAWKQRSAATAYDRAALEAEKSWRAGLTEIDPEIAKDPFPRIKLDDRIATLRGQLGGGRDVGRPRPIAEEFDTLAFVLASVDGIVLLESGFRTDLAASHLLLVPDVQTGEDLVGMLNGASRHVEYVGRFPPSSRRSRIYSASQFPELRDHREFSLTGVWREPSDGGGGAP
ncbi:MAG: hypothetical protein AAF108_10855 [Planctomycetota bacterium]